MTRGEFVQVADNSIPCYVVTPSAPTKQERAVVLLSDIYGCQHPDTHAVAAKFAEATSSTVWIPDVFRGGPWPARGPAAGTADFEEWRSQFTDEWLVDVTEACTAYAVAKGASRVALLGFCYGGGRVVDSLANAANSPDTCLGACVVGGAAFYGTRISRIALARVNAPLLLCFAEEDGLVPSADVKEFERVVEGLQTHATVRVFQGQPHGFVHQPGVGDERAAEDAVNLAATFLNSVLA